MYIGDRFLRPRLDFSQSVGQLVLVPQISLHYHPSQDAQPMQPQLLLLGRVRHGRRVSGIGSVQAISGVVHVCRALSPPYAPSCSPVTAVFDRSVNAVPVDRNPL